MDILALLHQPISDLGNNPGLSIGGFPKIQIYGLDAEALVEGIRNKENPRFFLLRKKRVYFTLEKFEF